jgi:hypothetical protein
MAVVCVYILMEASLVTRRQAIIILLTSDSAAFTSCTGVKGERGVSGVFLPLKGECPSDLLG